MTGAQGFRFTLLGEMKALGFFVTSPSGVIRVLFSFESQRRRLASIGEGIIARGDS